MEKWCSSIHSIGGVDMVSGAYLVQAKQALACLFGERPRTWLVLPPST